MKLKPEPRHRLAYRSSLRPASGSARSKAMISQSGVLASRSHARLVKLQASQVLTVFPWSEGEFAP